MSEEEKTSRPIEFVRDDLAARARRFCNDLANDPDLQRQGEAERRDAAEERSEVFYVLIKDHGNGALSAECVSGLPDALRLSGVKLPRAAGSNERSIIARLHWAYALGLARAKYGDLEKCRQRARRAKFVVIQRMPASADIL